MLRPDRKAKGWKVFSLAAGLISVLTLAGCGGGGGGVTMGSDGSSAVNSQSSMIKLEGILTARLLPKGKGNGKEVSHAVQESVSLSDATVDIVDASGKIIERGKADSSGFYSIEVASGTGPYFIKAVRGNVALKAIVIDPQKSQTVEVTSHSTAIVKIMEEKLATKLGEEGIDGSDGVTVFDVVQLVADIEGHPYTATVEAAILDEIVTKKDFSATSVTLGSASAAGSALSATIAGDIKIAINSSGEGDKEAPKGHSVIINKAAHTTGELSVSLSLAGTDNRGIIAYHVSEIPTTPAASFDSWVLVSQSTNLSKEIPFVLSRGNGLKTVYLWIRDLAGNVSSRVADTIYLSLSDTTAPYNLFLTINDNKGSTTDNLLTFSIKGEDDQGITGYYVSTTIQTPQSDSVGWVEIDKIKIYEATVPYLLKGGTGTQAVYLWLKDGSGNISDVVSQVITINGGSGGGNQPPVNNSVNFINGGAGTTISRDVTLSLSAVDDKAVTAYYASESPIVPSASAAGWTALSSAFSLKKDVSFTLSEQVGNKKIYLWFKDEEGQISPSTFDSIVLDLTDVEAPSGASIIINFNEPSTSTIKIITALDAIDNVGITGLYVSESPTVPALNAAGWQAVQPVRRITVYYPFRVTSGDGLKRVYAWFRDQEGNISTAVSDTINLYVMPKISDSGQSDCWDTSGSLINCANTGMDGEFTVNPPSFTNMGDGTIKDNNSLLLWEKSSTTQKMDWYAAMSHCENLLLAGYSDWRMPTRRELISIADYGRLPQGPAIDESYFSNTEHDPPFLVGAYTPTIFYWSSTSQVASGGGSAWGLEFESGGGAWGLTKTDLYHIRCTRNPTSGGVNRGGDYVDNGDGTITGLESRIMWQKDTNAPTNWDTALAHCRDLTFAGYSDWRLPNVRELESLSDLTAYGPAIDLDYFPDSYVGPHWTGTTYPPEKDRIRGVGFMYGGVQNILKTENVDYFRCIRNIP